MRWDGYDPYGAVAGLELSDSDLAAACLLCLGSIIEPGPRAGRGSGGDKETWRPVLCCGGGRDTRAV